MIRRLRALGWSGKLALLGVAECAAWVSGARAQATPPGPALKAPIFVYDSGAAPDGHSADALANNEEAMRELAEAVRLERAGVRWDGFIMDGQWFAPDGGYRVWRAEAWPKGPETWIQQCRAHGIPPGLWFATNTLDGMSAATAWKDSLESDGRAMSMFEGGFLTDFMAVLQQWYDRGVRIFGLGLVDLAAVTTEGAATLSREEIRVRNAAALGKALEEFRKRNPAAVLLVVEKPGLGASGSKEPGMTGGLAALGGLGVFDLVSTGPAPTADAPEVSLQRSLDISTDAAVRRLERSGIPLARIESPGLVLGRAGNAAGGNADSARDSDHDLPRDRGRGAWKGSLLLELARGGRVDAVRGDLELIRDGDAFWMARAQRLFIGLEARGGMDSFGGAPDGDQAYGFAGVTARGAIYVAVNPGQAMATLTMPEAAASAPGRVQFRDAGFAPRLSGNKLTLGPGEMAMVGYGVFAQPRFNFGVQEEVVIPKSIEPVPAQFQATRPGVIEADIEPPMYGELRVVMRRRAPQGSGRTAPGDARQSGGPRDETITIEATQNGRTIPMRVDEDALAWSGIHWAVVEIDVNDLTPGLSVRVQFRANEDADKLVGSAYQVEY